MRPRKAEEDQFTDKRRKRKVEVEGGGKVEINLASCGDHPTSGGGEGLAALGVTRYSITLVNH